MTKGFHDASQTHLNNHHRNTLSALFQHPTSHNVRWEDVVSLLDAVGAVEERHDGKIKVTVGGQTEFLETPRDHNASVDQIVGLRRMLRAAGFAEDG